MKTIAQLLLVCITFLLVNPSKASVICNEINDRKTITKPFTNIDIDGAFTVILNQGDTESVFIESENSMMPYINSSVKNNTLKITLKTGLGTKTIKEIKLHITVKNLKSLKLSGFIDLETSKQINFTELNLNCSGAVNVKLNSRSKSLICNVSSLSEIFLLGNTDNLDIIKTDASTVNAFQLKANNVSIRSLGFGEVNVSAINTLNITSNGPTSIKYKGNPSKTAFDIKGLSTLKKLK